MRRSPTIGLMIAGGMREREMETRLVGSVVRLDRVIIIVASRAQKGSPMDPGIGNGVIKDLQNGVCLVGVEGTSSIQVARQLGPMSTADGASHTTMAHIRGNASEMERVGALSCEDRLPRTVA